MTEEMNPIPGQAGEELNELMQARRDKLAAIIDKGIEPFGRHYILSCDCRAANYCRQSICQPLWHGW